jgi:hypothetical protein
MAVGVDRSLRLSDREYFAEPQAKTGIALRHTVCDKARTTLMLWQRDRTAGGKPRRVATAYVIDRDGTIFQAFDPACWAFQFGLNWRQDHRTRFERRFIASRSRAKAACSKRSWRCRVRSVAVLAARLSEPHIAELRRPRIRFGSAWAVLGAAGVGLVLERVMP